MDLPGRTIEDPCPLLPNLSSISVAGSLRDPAGQLFQLGDRIVRLVKKAGEPALKAFLSSRTSEKFVRRGALVKSRYLDPEEAYSVLMTVHEDGGFHPEIGTVIEHERLPFPSFPYEWPSEMLAAAASLTLEIGEALLDDGLGLKDATPYNVLFRGPQPVFVDILSAECREPDDPTWLPYAQFVRTFLLPLLVHRFCGVSPSLYLAGNRDGIEPEEVYRLLSFFGKLQPPALGLVTIPTWLARSQDGFGAAIYEKRAAQSPSQARFILRSMFRTLRKSLKKTKAGEQNSAWSDYEESHSYSISSCEAKRRFIEEALEDFEVKSLLDAGCNTGWFSIAAAKKGIRVVAIDADSVVVGTLWKKAIQQGLDILPLVVNVARPSPATGWRNQECASFLDRSRNRFDAVLMLALIHHLMAAESIPLSEIFRLGWEITRTFLIVAYIDPADAMFRRIVRGRQVLFQSMARDVLEVGAKCFFDIVREHSLGPTRHLYVMVKKNV